MGTMSNYHANKARSYLAAVEATQAHLGELYAEARKPMPPEARNACGARIAEAHQSIRYGSKVALIHAVLALAPTQPPGQVIA